MIEIANSISGAIVMVSCVVAILIAAVFSYVSKPLKILGIYFVIGTSTELFSLICSLNRWNNLYLFHLFTLIEIIVLSILFGELFKKLGSKVKVEKIAIPVSIVIVMNTVFIQGIDEYNSYSTTLASIVIIGYCLYYFSLSLDKPNQTIQANSVKWAIICIFFYHCISLIVLLFSNVLLEIGQKPNLVIIVWALRATVILATKVVLLIIFGRLLSYYFKPKIL